MKLQEILMAAGKARRRKRVGRGTGSGRGKTCGRGHKGYGSRSGSGALLGFEGGQNPMLARIPRRGFSNARFRRDYQIVNVGSLGRFDEGARVDPEAMAEARLVREPHKPIKILGKGQIEKKLTVVASKFSDSAAKKITEAGGQIEQL